MKRLVIFLVLFGLVSGLYAQEYKYEEWQWQYHQAKSNLRASRVVLGVGIFTALFGGALALADKETIIIKEEQFLFGWQTVPAVTKEKFKPGYLIIMGGGLGISIFGGIYMQEAKQRVEYLEQMGIRKGYITASIQPEYKGVSISVRLSF